jgi:aryl-alcohol dehydrogenase-like predicted oxidoreductase
MQYVDFGRTGMKLSTVSYGGIVSAGDFDGAICPEVNQKGSDRYVAWAIERGVNYFDAAPSYGDTQLQLGNSLRPYRQQVNLTSKTLERDRKGAEKELKESLKLLHTDYLDVYQLHAVNSAWEVEAAFAPGGVMELMRELKEKGIARNIGFSSHDEDTAIRMIELYDFDSVLFPFNWFMNMEHGMGNRLLQVAKERNMGILAMKSFVERSWDSVKQRYASKFPKSWCKPIDVEDEAFGVAAMKYALGLGVDTLIPPGNYASFSFAVEHIDECLANPLNDADRSLLQKKLESVRGKEFF